MNRIAAHLAQPQHRNAACLLLVNVLGAATGLLFWILLARVLGVPAREVGLGYTIVALGTLVGVVAKGGFDTALLRAVPASGSRHARGLFAFACLLAGAVAVAMALVLALLSPMLHLGIDAAAGSRLAWALVAALGVLLVVSWLQDARFLAEGDARPSLRRNLALSAARLALPAPAVLLAAPAPVAVSWGLALGVSVAVGILLAGRLPHREAPSAPQPTRRRLVTDALHNAASSAAEFLPGLLLAPIVLSVAGPDRAAYFGMAWTAATLLFLASSALARSALAELVRHPERTAATLRRGVVQHLALVLPAAVAAMLAAPLALRVFGPAYAANGAWPLILLAASAPLVAAGNLYLAVLRARTASVALTAFPLLMVALLLALTPPLLRLWGLPGVAVAWAIANAPLGAVGAVRLARLARAPAHDREAAIALAEPEPVAAGGAP